MLGSLQFNNEQFLLQRLNQIYQIAYELLCFSNLLLNANVFDSKAH